MKTTGTAKGFPSHNRRKEVARRKKAKARAVRQLESKLEQEKKKRTQVNAELKASKKQIEVAEKQIAKSKKPIPKYKEMGNCRKKNSYDGPFEWNEKALLAAKLIAQGTMSKERISIECGISRATLAFYEAHTKFNAEVHKLAEAEGFAVSAERTRIINRRLAQIHKIIERKTAYVLGHRFREPDFALLMLYEKEMKYLAILERRDLQNSEFKGTVHHIVDDFRGNPQRVKVIDDLVNGLPDDMRDKVKAHLVNDACKIIEARQEEMERLANQREEEDELQRGNTGTHATDGDTGGR
jgi:hypothetical protein